MGEALTVGETMKAEISITSWPKDAAECQRLIDEGILDPRPLRGAVETLRAEVERLTKENEELRRLLTARG